MNLQSVCCVQIAMPRPVRSLNYNHLEGYIACGGDDGVLKAVKLESKNGRVVHFLSSHHHHYHRHSHHHNIM